MFSVCVATVRPNTLLSTVNAVRRQTWEDWELIIVGQGDCPELATLIEQIKQSDPRIRYIHLAQKGLSRARNAAIRAARGQWIAMTDDDCEPAEDWLEVIAAYFQSGQNISLVGGSLIQPPRPRGKIGTCPGGVMVEALYDPAATPHCPPLGWDIVGGNLAVTRDLTERIGLFDEHLGAGAHFPAGEDTDYKLRIEALGLKMVSTPRSVVTHTYGWRFGMRTIIRHLSAYSRGNGALAGKLTLQKDPRGEKWLNDERRFFIERVLTPQQCHRIPLAINRLKHFTEAYQECVAHFRIDPDTGMLQPKLDSMVAA